MIASYHERNQSHPAAVNDLEVSLQRKLRGKVRDLRLLEKDEGLILCGCSDTYYAKQLAQHTLLDVTSRPLLRNEIQVM